MTTKPPSIFSHVGTFIDTKLIKLEAQDTNFKHLDYFPMVNARVHSVGERAS